MDRFWLQKEPLIRDANLREFLHRVHILIIKIIGALQYNNLSRRPRRNSYEFRVVWNGLLKSLESGQPIWQRGLALVVLTNISTMFRMLIIQSHQYSYDFDRFRLERLKMSQMADATEAEYLEMRIEQHREVLKSFGSPHREWTMMNEFLHDYLMSVNVLNLIIAPIYLALSGGYHVPWLQYCVDPEAEIEFQTEVISKQLENYTNSSRLYIMSQFSPPDMGASTQAKLSGLRRLQISGELAKRVARCGSIVQAGRYEAKLDQINRIEADGRLRVFISRSAGWLDRLMVVNLFIVATVLVYACLATVMCHNFIMRFFDSRERHVSLESHKDVLSLLSFCYILAGVILSAASSFVLTLCSTLDTYRLVHLIKWDILTTVDRNVYLLEEIRIAAKPKSVMNFASISITEQRFKPTNHRRQSLKKILSLICEIETETMASILRYKWFCAHYQRSKRSLEINSALVFAYGGLAPVLARLHVPYLTDYDSRFLIMIAGLVAMIPCLLFSWLNCLLHSRCLELHDCLTRLLAQLIGMKLDDSVRNNLNMDHEIMLLRKELERPQEMSHQFAIKLLGVMDFTFANLIRVEFWIVLLAISLISNLNSMGGRLHFLSDPFGVFD